MVSIEHSTLTAAQKDILKALLKGGPNELHRAVGKYLTALKYPDGIASDFEIKAALQFAESVRESLVAAAMEDPESEFSWSFTPIYGDYVDALDKGTDDIAAVGGLIEELWATAQALPS